MKLFLKHSAAICLALVLVFHFGSCKKEGTGGKSSVNGNVKHHNELIPNTDVYIKYGVKEFPGADVSSYDDHVQADANAHYEFTGLQKGDYYLYGVGTDASGIPFVVTGGVGVELKRNQASNIDVPVTED